MPLIIVLNLVYIAKNCLIFLSFYTKWDPPRRNIYPKYVWYFILSCRGNIVEEVYVLLQPLYFSITSTFSVVCFSIGFSPAYTSTFGIIWIQSTLWCDIIYHKKFIWPIAGSMYCPTPHKKSLQQSGKKLTSI